MTSRPFLLRLLLPFAVILTLIITVCGTAIFWAQERALRAQQIEQLDSLTAVIAPLAAHGDAFGAEQAARIRAAAEALRTRVTLIDGDGRVFFDSFGAPDRMENHNSRPEVIGARAGGSASDVRRSRTIDDGSVYVAKLLDPTNPQGTVVRLSYPQRQWVDLRSPAWIVVAAGVLCALLATAVLAAMLLQRWISPVRELSLAAERMAAGDWAVRAAPRGAEELRLFSGRLNEAAAAAQMQLAQLRDQRADLAALVDMLPDPLLVTDAQRRIVLINPPASALLQLPAGQVVGRTAESVVNEQAILQVIERQDPMPHDAPPREIRLTRDGHQLVYQAMATPTAGKGMLLVLRDVSALSNAVQMKADFVANASHELRTPLAAIKIAFETLREVYQEDPAQTQRCVAIIDGHIRRLEEMLRDLLDLSRVETPDLKPRLAELHGHDLFAVVRPTLEPMARQKGVTLDLEGGQTHFVSDLHLLSLVLKNLVENSIKFTPAGGTVTVSIERAAGDRPAAGADFGPVVLRVTDTGIGIPPEHVDRVFERFYQVSAARTGSGSTSGSGRGTGLGLAIVKHALAALGGTVHLESTVGQGTLVTCALPGASPDMP